MAAPQNYLAVIKVVGIGGGGGQLVVPTSVPSRVVTDSALIAKWCEPLAPSAVGARVWAWRSFTTWMQPTCPKSIRSWVWDKKLLEV